jgi:hypothetical protein
MSYETSATYKDGELRSTPAGITSLVIKAFHLTKELTLRNQNYGPQKQKGTKEHFVRNIKYFIFSHNS